MFTRRALDRLLKLIVSELFELGINPEKVVLFGSYANGGIHPYSDIDIAVWSQCFIGEGMIDFELIRPLIRKHKNIDIKMYPLGATSDNFDPFISVIEKTGRALDLSTCSAVQSQ